MLIQVYTDKELVNIDPPPFTFEGRTYTAYEATQKQRSLERTIRKQRRLKTAYEAAGLTEESDAAGARLRTLNRKYRKFSQAAGLPEQRERMRVSYVEDSSKAKAAKRLEKAEKSVIMKPEQSSEVPGVNKVCDLNIKRYQCITPDITTSEVIITDERIRHIKDHHPGHFETIKPFLKSVIDAPNYILADAPNTGLLLKLIEEDGLRIQMVLRLHTSTDSPEFKNSIISAWKISEIRWKNYLRNKKILYKSE